MYPDEERIMTESAPALEAIRRPDDGTPANDRIFLNTATGNRWRVRVAATAPYPANLVTLDKPAPPVQPTVHGRHVSVCLIDESLAVVCDAGDRPMAFEQASKTFDEIDFTADDFNPDQVIAGIIQARIAAAELTLVNRGKLYDFDRRWTKDAPSGPDRSRAVTQSVAVTQSLANVPAAAIEAPVMEAPAPAGTISIALPHHVSEGGL